MISDITILATVLSTAITISVPAISDIIQASFISPC